MKAKASPVRYFTGQPCLRGHICERYTSNKNCVDCVSIYDQRRIGRRNTALVPHRRGPGAVKLPLWFPERMV